MGRHPTRAPANQLGVKAPQGESRAANTATGINYLRRNRCYRSVCFSKDNEINKWKGGEKKKGSEKMKWWRGGVLWNCAVKRFSFLISWSADDGACALTAESDKKRKEGGGEKRLLLFFHLTSISKATFINIIIKQLVCGKWQLTDTMSLRALYIYSHCGHSLKCRGWQPET